MPCFFFSCHKHQQLACCPAFHIVPLVVLQWRAAPDGHDGELRWNAHSRYYAHVEIYQRPLLCEYHPTNGKNYMGNFRNPQLADRFDIRNIKLSSVESTACTAEWIYLGGYYFFFRRRVLHWNARLHIYLSVTLFLFLYSYFFFMLFLVFFLTFPLCQQKQKKKKGYYNSCAIHEGRLFVLGWANGRLVVYDARFNVWQTLSHDTISRFCDDKLDYQLVATMKHGLLLITSRSCAIGQCREPCWNRTKCVIFAARLRAQCR